MSKRAEELADKIGYATFDRDEVAALIDAELRKERERCAERWEVEWWGLPNIPIDALRAGASSEQLEVIAVYRAAILSEGE